MDNIEMPLANLTYSIALQTYINERTLQGENYYKQREELEALEQYKQHCAQYIYNIVCAAFNN